MANPTPTSQPKKADATNDVGKTKSVFVISPIGSQGTEGYRKAKLCLDFIIKKALPESVWEVTRGDGSLSPDSIGHDIIERIDKADLIIADLTDQNPNVFYELAIAHGWEKPVIHIIESGQPIPFDVADLRTIPYDLSDPESVDSAITAISGIAANIFSTAYQPKTPLTQFNAFKRAKGSLDPESAQAEINEQILSRLVSIELSLRPNLGTRAMDSSGRVLSSAKFAKRLQGESTFMSGPDHGMREFIELSRELDPRHPDFDMMSSTVPAKLKKWQIMWELLSVQEQEAVKNILEKSGISVPPFRLSKD
ncbi:hypothetical protein [Arthrobacter sp. MYb213]|uniref:hypothetical protein n=1 Tax=Arthrobacter sp. MYb213 TaxID=1848595 RepID=UPI000CFACED8|nr:hypothetical protein [Arthrobacter sp. MYb213]PRB72509.1 hypothetical protein CQ011_02320 [Arthrobacter sp. MYb213]